MFTVGELVVTVCVSLPAQPLPSVTLTLKVVVVDGETVMVRVVAPVDHEYDAKPAPASSVTGDPEHDVDGPVMFTTGSGLTLTVCVSLPVQPLPFVTLTV